MGRRPAATRPTSGRLRQALSVADAVGGLADEAFGAFDGAAPPRLAALADRILAEVDDRVYALYGLTAEERAAVEGG